MLEDDADDSDDDDAAPTPRGAADGGAAAVLATAARRRSAARPRCPRGLAREARRQRLNMPGGGGGASSPSASAPPPTAHARDDERRGRAEPLLLGGSRDAARELQGQDRAGARHVGDTLAPADDSTASDGGASGPLAAVAAAASAAADGASGAGGGSLSPVELSFLATKSESYGTLDAVDAPAPATAGGAGSMMAASAARGGRAAYVDRERRRQRDDTCRHRQARLAAARDDGADHAAWVQALQQCIASVTEPASAKEASDPSSGWTPLGRSSIVAGLTGAARKGSARKGSAAG